MDFSRAGERPRTQCGAVQCSTERTGCGFLHQGSACHVAAASPRDMHPQGNANMLQGRFLRINHPSRDGTPAKPAKKHAPRAGSPPPKRKPAARKKNKAQTRGPRTDHPPDLGVAEAAALDVVHLLGVELAQALGLEPAGDWGARTGRGVFGDGTPDRSGPASKHAGRVNHVLPCARPPPRGRSPASPPTAAPPPQGPGGPSPLDLMQLPQLRQPPGVDGRELVDVVGRHAVLKRLFVVGERRGEGAGTFVHSAGKRGAPKAHKCRTIFSHLPWHKQTRP
jgi:hypothetical protein